MNKSVYGLVWLELSLLALQSKSRFKALPIEEQRRIEQERKDREERQRVSWFLDRGKCPSCTGKLARGKKDKHNNYKRELVCTKCNNSYYR